MLPNQVMIASIVDDFAWTSKSARRNIDLILIRIQLEQESNSSTNPDARQTTHSDMKEAGLRNGAAHRIVHSVVSVARLSSAPYDCYRHLPYRTSTDPRSGFMYAESRLWEPEIPPC